MTRMADCRVLVVSRKSELDLLPKSIRSSLFKKLSSRKDPEAADILLAHREHRHTLEVLKEAAERLHLKARFVHRINGVKADAFDLVVTVGGDGTLLHASHHIGPTPVLAVNSSPSTSLGYLTAARAENLEERLRAAVEGRLRPKRLERMAIAIEERTVYTRVLNDVLFCHACPASTTHYTIRLGDKEEPQVSSGVWVSTAAGSTAAILAANGRVTPPSSRRLQYVVREPHSQRRKDYRLLHGFVPLGEQLRIATSLHHEAKIYVDGPDELFTVRRGERVAFFVSDEPLLLLGFDPARIGSRKKTKGR